MSRGLEFSCGVWSRKSEYEAVSASTSQAERSPAGALASAYGTALHRITRIVLLLTHRNTYIRRRDEELCSNPANWRRGTGVGVGCHCLEVMCRWYEASQGKLHRTTEALCDSGSSLQQLTPDAAKVTRDRCLAPQYAPSLLRIQTHCEEYHVAK